METLIMNPDGTVPLGPRMLGVIDYAKHIGKGERTVREWLKQGKLPSARKDGAGAWMISEDDRPAEPLNQLALVQPAPPHELEAAAETEPTGFLTLHDAARELGVPAEAITEDPEYFSARRVGRRNATGERTWMVPRRAVKAFRGD